MRKIVAYFSPTGGTEKIARLIADEAGAELMDITVYCYDLSFEKDDLLFFCFPVYGGRIPHPMRERMAGLEGCGANAVMVAVYGNRAVDDALLEMSDLCADRGFKTVGGIEMVAPHSLDKRIAADRPDEKDKADLHEFIKTLLNKESFNEVTMPGKRPYVKYGGAALRPSAGTKCTGCGTCSVECPAGAIDPGDPRVPDKEKCIGCMRCVKLCPFGNRSVPVPAKLAVSAALRSLCSKRKAVKYYL